MARSLERYQRQNICIADLEARPEAYPDLGTVEEIRQHVTAIRRKDGKLAHLMIEIEEEQRDRPENENLLSTLNALIASRHVSEQGGECESDVDRG
jgi:hypothetical protein